MKKIKNKKFIRQIEKAGFDFDYAENSDEIVILSYDYMFEGGFAEACTLDEKRHFYEGCSIVADFVKTFVCENEKRIYVGGINEAHKTVETWADIKQYNCYQNFLNYFKKNQAYRLDVATDLNYLDYIIENNFRYLTRMQIFLPESEIIMDLNVHFSVDLFGKQIRDKEKQISSILEATQFKRFEKMLH